MEAQVSQPQQPNAHTQDPVLSSNPPAQVSQPSPQVVPQPAQSGSSGGGGGGGGGGVGKKTSVSFGTLMPYLQTLVGPEKNVQLNSLYQRMKGHEITREDFVRGARVICGEKVILEALNMMNGKSSTPREEAPSNSASTSGLESGIKRPAPEPLGAPSKKQKLDPVHSLEQINDVTAVSGVNIKEEEERLLTAPRQESRVTAEMRRRFMEEDGRFFLEKGPLHAKVQEVVAKAGLKNISEDVERCLSMSAEEMLWTLLVNSIKASKQRCDVEKDRHRIMLSQDLYKTLTAVRKGQHEFRQRKQAEENERLRKLNEEKSAAGEEGKDGTKTIKSQQLDDKMRTTAANIAARKAVGADDLTSKWMLMAERQKQADAWGGQRFQDPSTPAAANKQTFGGAGTPRGNARRSSLPQALRTSRSVTLKDVAASIERNPTMNKPELLYKIYERIPSE